MLEQLPVFSIIRISIPSVVPAKSETDDNRIRVIGIGAYPDDGGINKRSPMLGK